MIELGKVYRTRDGREVRIYAVDGGGEFPVHGAWHNGNGDWRVQQWPEDGSFCGDNAIDLIEIRPRAIDRIESWLEGYVRNAGQQLSGETITVYRNVLELVRQLKAEEDAQS